MNFRQILGALAEAHEHNILAVRNWRARRAEDPSADITAAELLTIPVFSGPSGMGKTAAVRQFAAQRGFELSEIATWAMDAAGLATFMHVAIVRLAHGHANGHVILMDDFDQADEDWLAVCRRYARHRFDSLINVAVDERSGRVSRERRHYDIPEGLLLVGEQRLDLGGCFGPS